MCIPVVMFAQQNGVTVDKLVVNAGTVTFNVRWDKAAMPKQVWSDTVWVWVDYNKNGVMERLPLVTSGATLTNTSPGGKVVTAPGNDSGVWVVGNAREAGAFSATVKLPTTIVALAGVCAYVSNYPPVGNYTSATKVSFTGTPEYNITIKEDIGGALESQKSASPYTVPAGYTVQSFTDKTGAPGTIKSIMPATYTLSGANVCAGETAALMLSGSQNGWRYQLRKNNTPVGAIIDGTGSALSFPDVPGNYNYSVWTVDNPTVLAQRAMQVSNTHTVTVQALPDTPVLTTSGMVCRDGVLVAGVTSPVSGATYMWTASSGTSNGSSYTFNTSIAGAKTATVYSQVTAGGVTCKSANSGRVTVLVQGLPATPAIEVSTSTVCQHADLTFKVITPTSGATYMWTGSAGTYSGSSYTFNTSTVGARTATVYVLETLSGLTCKSANARTATANVRALPSTPEISVSASTVCQHAALTFRVTSPVPGATYTWIGSTGTSNGSSYTFKTSNAGAKTATVYSQVTLVGLTCQSANATTATAVVVARPSDPLIVRSASTVCQGTNIVFTASGTVGSSFTWSGNPAGTPSGAGNCSYTVSGAATGTKSVTAFASLTSSGTTCQSANAATVTAVVAARPSDPTIVRSAATVCQNTNIVFTASGTSGSSFTWSGNPTGTASGTGSCSYTVSGAATGTKSVTAYARLTSSGTTCQSANAATVTAVVAVRPSSPIIVRSAATVCQGTNIVFTASGMSGSSFTWSGTPTGTASGTGSCSYTVSGTATGTKSVTAYARLTSSGTTCQSANATTVTAVMTARPSDPTIARSAATVCQNTNIIFTATGTSGSTFVWSGTGTASGTGNCSYTVSGAELGAKTVSVYARAVSNGVTCSSSYSMLSSAVVIPYPTITVQPQSVHICYNGGFALPVKGYNATAYRWMKNGSSPYNSVNITSTSFTANISSSSVTSSTTYSLVAANGACSTTSANAVVSLTTAPDATVNFTAFDPCETAAFGTVWYLTDRRESDNVQTYKVKMMTDNRIWMIQDMKFGNLCNRTSFSGSATDRQGYVSDIFVNHYGYCTNKTTRKDVSAARGYLYDWPAAMNAAGAYYGGTGIMGCRLAESGTGRILPTLNINYPASCQGICPVGWHVPTKEEWEVTFNNKDTGYTVTEMLTVFQGAVPSEYVEHDGDMVNVRFRYWTSSPDEDDKNDALSARSNDTSILQSDNAAQRRSGLAVRCVRNY
jgi:uncharacterized protein (TIGR02145 family)